MVGKYYKTFPRNSEMINYQYITRKITSIIHRFKIIMLFVSGLSPY